MKQNVPSTPNLRLSNLFFIILTFMVSLISCKKSDNLFRDFSSPSQYSDEVIDKWITLQLRLIKNATGIANGAFSRPVAYAGITAYESTDPGTFSWKKKYNGISSIPNTDKSQRYFWPASVNAALASINRSFFTSVNSNSADIAAIDSLENAINSSYASENPERVNRSAGFGKSIADAIFAWSQTDGYNENSVLPYTPPVGLGLWVPTPPAFGKASGPFLGNDRPIIEASGNNAQPGAPTTFSEDPGSPFYTMVNDLYVASKSLTDDQKSMALFWRDVPGATTPGHWLSIVEQVLKQTNSRLDKAAMTYALVGICLNDAVISVFKAKYTYNLIRPVTYIRNVIGDATWLPYITTPAHPEYPAAHAVLSSAAAEGLTGIFGDIDQFSDHTYDYLGFAPRNFNSFRAIAVDAGNSRFYGGIHYQPSINTGLEQGRRVAANILNKLEIGPKGEK